MALVYVGGTSGVGTTATYAVSLSGTLTGGTNASPSAGDVVVVYTGCGNTAAITLTVSGDNSGAYPLVDGTSQYHQNDTWDAELACFYFRQGTVDTSLTIGRPANGAYGGGTVVQVWRGVDDTTPFDVTATAAGAGNTGLINPPAITPTTSGAVILAGGTGTQTTAGSAFVVSSNMTGPSVSVKGDGTTSDAGVCIASHEWTSGAFTPNVVTGGTVSTSCAWRAVTLALRPASTITTGTLAATDTDVDTAAMSGTVAWGVVAGTAAATDTDADTLVASGSVLVQGALAATDTDVDTAASTGLVLVQGAIAATDTDVDTFAASGTVSDPSVGGSVAATEDFVDSASISGTVLVQGALAATESTSDTLASAGLVLVQGALAATGADTDTAALMGTVLVQGALASTEAGADTAAATGSVPITGTLAATDGDSDTAQISTATIRTGSIDATETTQDTTSIAGTVFWIPVAGSLTATDTGEDSAAITGEVFITGLFSATETDQDTATALGKVYIYGGLAALEEALDICFMTGTAIVRSAAPSRFQASASAFTNSSRVSGQRYASTASTADTGSTATASDTSGGPQ